MQLFDIDGVQFYYISEGESFNAAIALLHNQRQGQWGLPIAAIDTETNGANPRIHQVRLLQIAQPNCPAVVFDLGGFTLTTAQRQLLNGFLGDPTLLKVLQGGKFDLKMLAAMGLMLSPPFFDTMLVSQIVTAGRDLKHTLGDLALRYLGIELDKSLQTSFVGMAIGNPLSPQQLKYGAIDVLVLLELLPVLTDSLKKFKTSQTTWQREQQMLPVLAALETGGIQVDEGALRQLRYDLIVEQEKAGEALQAMLNYGDDIDLMGNPLTIDLTNSRELKQAVEGLGLGVPSLDDTDLLAKAHYQEIDAVLDYLKWAKQH
jgi:DNA polymerase I